MALGSFFSNLFQKKDAEPVAAARSSGPATAPGESGEAKIRRRLAVDQAVTVALAAAGVPASGYKHDAKRMDASGQRFFVTVDLNREFAGASAGKLSQVGVAITQYAKSKGETEVAAVYWRVEEGGVAAGPVNLAPEAAEPAVQAAQSPGATAPSPAKIAASAASAPAPQAASEKIAKLRAMMGNYESAASSEGGDRGFQKTQVMEAFEDADAGKYEKTQVMKAVSGADSDKSGKT